MDDAALAAVIQAAQRGEPAAYDRLVDLFASRVAGFLYRMTGSRQESEDLVQEVFLRLVRMIGAYQHDGRFEPWLFRIAANLARDRVRRAKRAPTFASEKNEGANGDGHNTTDRLNQLPSAHEAADTRMIHDEDMRALNSALQLLPDGEREVIMLRHFSQLSFKEIADLTGTPLGTALARAHRGLAKLRELMSDAPAQPTIGHVRAVSTGGC